MNWRIRENEGVYIFFEPFGVLWHDISKNILPIPSRAWLQILHIMIVLSHLLKFFLLGVSSQWVVFFIIPQKSYSYIKLLWINELFITRQNELLTGTQFVDYGTPTKFSAICEILTSDWLEDVIQSAAYVTIKCRER